MIALDELCPDIVPDLERVAAEIAGIAASGYAPLGEAAHYLATTPGKRLRPGLLLLAARACGYDGPRCIVPAAVVEVLHCVSLVHDDVIDGADTRRGAPAARALWGNKLAVLLGDHLLAGALRRLAETGDQVIMTDMAGAAMEMCRGQVQEIMSCGPGLAEAHYLEIVSAKTASLFAASARLGAIAADAVRSQMAALDAFGRSFGIAYQITDDILDLTATPRETGKSAARDLAQGQVTLPIIYGLREGSAAQRAELLAALDGAPEHVGANGCSPLRDLVRIRKLIADTGGFEYASGCARRFCDQAAATLSGLAQSPARECLLTLARGGLAAPILARR